MEGRNDIGYWGDRFRDAAGKTVEAILKQGEVVAEAIASGITQREYAKEIGKSQGAVNQYDQIGKDSRLKTISFQLPDRMKAIYQCAQLNDEQLAMVTPDMTEAKVKALREPKRDGKVKRGSYRKIAISAGLISGASQAMAQKIKEEILSVDPGIEIGTYGLDPEMIPRVEAACAELAARRGKTDEEFCEEEQVNLSMSAQQRLDAVVRAYKRRIDAEYNERLNAAVQAELEVLLPEYNSAHDRHLSIINAYRGVFTRPEYRLLLSAMHPDKYPGLDQVQRARLEKAFSLLKDKELELCGVEQEETNTLPKTVADLLKRRGK